jgi:acyl carrier protein
MKDTLRRYVGEQLLGDGAVAITDDDDLLDIGVDSLGMATFVLFIETEWNIVIPPEDVLLENFQTIARIETYVCGRLGQSG